MMFFGRECLLPCLVVDYTVGAIGTLIKTSRTFPEMFAEPKFHLISLTADG